MPRHPDELCDNGCFECRDITNGGEQHSYDLDDGGVMRVVEYHDAYCVLIYSPENKDGRVSFTSSDALYWIEKESWKLMLAEEAHEYRQHRARLGIY